MPTRLRAAALHETAERIAARLSVPHEPVMADRRFAQSLGKGAAGTTLLHIERALNGLGTWGTAHQWVKAATRFDISAADEAALFIGAPSIAFVLHAANADGVNRYGESLTALTARVTNAAHHRVDAALARISAGQLTRFAEYDLFYGLTGIGALLLRYQRGNDALGRILAYLVRLVTEPVKCDGAEIPGWWVCHDPDQLVPTPGGHLNFGIAHGVAGPLALLSLAARAGVAIAGQMEAIESICAQLDAWRQGTLHGPWWPEWITLSELRARRVGRTLRPRSSWCYGTPGIARAQQLAAIASGDEARQADAEYALACSLSSPGQLARLNHPGVCHGIAGVYQCAWRANQDACTQHISTVLPELTTRLLAFAEYDGQDTSLLDGAAGLALALNTAARNTAPESGWDACLLLI